MKIAPSPDQAMGYDRAITIFSPDGRLLQVEYATKAVSSGALAMGIVCKDGVVLIADRRKVDELLVEEGVQKIFDLDEHVSVAAAGIMADARILVKNGRNFAQQHTLTYGEKVDIAGAVTHIADIMQAYTQYGGIRPFGISLLFGGVDKKGNHLFVVDPTGSFFKYKAKAVGEGAPAANAFLKTAYKEDVTTEQAIKLAKDIFKKVLRKDFAKEKLECSIIKQSGIEKRVIR